MGTTADSVVVELYAKTGTAGRDVEAYASKFEGASGRVERAASRIESGAARSANATRNLGRQVADIGVGLSSGQSFFLILAQQAPQVADALADTGGKAAKVAAFFAGPWGAAFLAAGSIVGVLAEKLYAASDAADKKKKSADALKEAVDRLNGSSAMANRTTEIGIQLDIAASKAMRDREVQTRRQIQAELELARGRLEAANVTATTGNGAVPGAIGFAAANQSRKAANDIADLTNKITEQNGKIAEADKAIRSGGAQLVLRGVAAATDKATAATQAYQDRIDALTRRFEAGKLGEDAFKRLATAATRTKDAALSAITEETAARRRADRESESSARRALKERQKMLEDLAEVARNTPFSIEKLSQSIKIDRGGLDKKGDDEPNVDPLAYQSKLKESQAAATAAADLRFSAEQDTDKKLAAQREEDVRSLADLYESLFTGGTQSIVKTFERLMIQTLAKLAAQKTISALGGSGGLLSGLTSLFGGGARVSTIGPLGLSNPNIDLSGINIPSLSGRASGGYVAPGQTYRVNEAGPELLRMGGQGGEVLSLGETKAATASGTTVIQNFTLDARGGIMTSELIASVDAKIQRVGQIAMVGGAAQAKADLARSARYRLG